MTDLKNWKKYILSVIMPLTFALIRLQVAPMFPPG